MPSAVKSSQTTEQRAISGHFWSRILTQAGSLKNREAGKRSKGTAGYDTVSATPHSCSPGDRVETEGIPPSYKQPDSNLPLEPLNEAAF